MVSVRSGAALVIYSEEVYALHSQCLENLHLRPAAAVNYRQEAFLSNRHQHLDPAIVRMEIYKKFEPNKLGMEFKKQRKAIKWHFVLICKQNIQSNTE